MTRFIRCARPAGILLAIHLLLSSPAQAEFRSFDGTGNNLVNPFWCSAATDYARMARVDYADGFDTPPPHRPPQPPQRRARLDAPDWC